MIKKEKLMNITAASLEKYLLFKNWSRDYNFPNRKLMVFEWNGESLVLPANEKYKDFYIILPKVIDVLAEIYNKSVNEIVKEITSSYYDLLEFRIKSKLSEDGELPLGYASNCIEGLKDLVLYSACAENRAEAVCLKATNNAKQVLDNFKLAQTDVGSFIINIDIKVVDEENEQLVLQQCEPPSSLEHKVVKRIGTAIQQIDDIVKEQAILDEMLSTAYKSGVTANICDAMMKLKPESTDVEIETKIRYASAVSRKLDDVDIVKIRGNHFYVMDEISRRYRNVESSERVIVTGIIKRLHKEPVAQYRYSREISIFTFLDGKTHTIRAELDETDYKLACDAHRDEQTVELRGILDKSGKIWRLIHIDSFEILED